MRMQTEITARKRIDAGQRAAMYALFEHYYDNADRKRFEQDLAAKDWVIRLCSKEGELVGFSTLQVRSRSFRAGAVTVLYSGDTIIERAHRRSGRLAGAFGHLLLRTIREHPGQPVFWLLTSKGVRTYRFLPVFFREFYPSCDRRTPFEIKQLVDALALEQFGASYSRKRQIVSCRGMRDKLVPSEHDPLLLRRNDPHVQFFLERNPGYVEGDELVCLARMSEENLNDKAWRVIRQTKVAWHE